MLKVEANNQTSNVDGFDRSLGHENPPPAPTKKRSKRRDVTGAHGLQVNENGLFYRSRHPVPLQGKHGHLIDPGKDYGGPVPPAYGGLWSGAYLADPDADRDAEQARLIIERRRRAADLVAYEFLGPPPGGWASARVAHLDGDKGNHHPDNLRWVDIAAAEQHSAAVNLMLSDITASRQFNKKGSRGPLYVPYYRKNTHRQPWMGERLDVPMRIAVAEVPPTRVQKWNPQHKQEKHHDERQHEASSV